MGMRCREAAVENWKAEQHYCTLEAIDAGLSWPASCWDVSMDEASTDEAKWILPHGTKVYLPGITKRQVILLQYKLATAIIPADDLQSGVHFIHLERGWDFMGRKMSSHRAMAKRSILCRTQFPKQDDAVVDLQNPGGARVMADVGRISRFARHSSYRLFPR